MEEQARILVVDGDEDLLRLKRTEDALRERTRQLEQRTTELNCLYSICELFERPGISLEEILQESVNLLHAAWQYPEATCARIIFEDQEFKTGDFRETAWRQASEFKVNGKPAGLVEVYYQREMPESDGEPFVEGESRLLNVIAERMGRVIEQVRGQEVIQQERDLVARIMETSPVGIAVFDTQGRITFANALVQQAARLTGDATLVGRAYNDPAWQIMTEDGEALPDHGLPFAQVMNTRQPVYDVCYAIQLPDGQRLFLSSNAAPLFDRSGEIGGVVVTTEDVTSRVRAEAALRESQERYRAISELTSDLAHAFRVEPDGSLVREWVTDAFSRITGFSSEELAARGGWGAVIHPDDLAAAQQHIEALLCGKQHAYELRIVTKDGEVRWLHDEGRPVWDEHQDRVVRIYGGTRDITERKRAEEALRENEKRYRQLLEMLQEGIWVIDQDVHTTFVNPRMAEMLGYGVEEMQGKHLFDFMDEEGVEICKRNLERRERGVKEQHDFEFLRKDGSRMYALLETSPMFDADGNYVGGIAGIQDITERVKAYEALRASEEKYRDLVEKVSDVIYTLNAGGVITYVSPAIETFLGYSPSEVVGRPFTQFITPEDLGRIGNSFQQLGSGDSPGSNEYRVVTKSGEVRWMRTSSQPILEGEQVAGVRGVLTDVTDRVRAEKQLEEAAAAAERERLARELHDAVTQALFSASLIAETLPRVLERHPQEGMQGLEAIRRLTHGALAEMRSLLLELRPAALGEQKLGALLRQLTDGMMARTQMQVTTTVVGDRPLPGEVQIALYRIAQEALNNVTKHAKARRATVSLDNGPDRVTLCISDDGSGFDPDSIQAHQLGVKIMRERSEAIGAEFRMGSRPGQGTEITVTWQDTSKDP